MRIFWGAVAVLLVVAFFLRGTDTLDSGADATVDVQLDEGVGLDTARSQLIAEAASQWQATRVAESTEDDSASVEFSLPGSSLDGFVAELRRHDLAREVDVTLEVDEQQLSPEPLASDDDRSEGAEPVRVEVILNRESPDSPWGPVLVLLLALTALGAVWLWTQRRSRGDDHYAEGPDSIV